MLAKVGDRLINIRQSMWFRFFVVQKDEARDHARIVGKQVAGRDRIDDALKLGAAAEHDLVRLARLSASLVIGHAHSASVLGEVEPIDAALDKYLGTRNHDLRIAAPGY